MIRSGRRYARYTFDARPTLQQMLIAFGGGGAASDPYFSDVKALLSFNGTDGSTTITDTSGTPDTFSVTGTAALVTANKQFGTASFRTGTGRAQSSSYSRYNVQAQAFTVEGWLYRSGGSGDRMICGQWTGAQDAWFIGIEAAHALVLYTKSSGGSYNFGAVGGTIPLNTWTYFAVSRNGVNAEGYVGASRTFNSTNQAATYLSASSTNFTVGQSAGGTATWVGDIDELRVTMGVARYTGASISIPGAAFPTF